MQQRSIHQPFLSLILHKSTLIDIILADTPALSILVLIIGWKIKSKWRSDDPKNDTKPSIYR